MRVKLLSLLLVCLIFPGVGNTSQADPVATKIRIGGSGAPMGGMQLLAAAFKTSHPQATVVVVPSLGSGGGLKALRAGMIDLALTSRPVKDAERSPDASVIEYARTPFVFAVAADTNARAITTPELIGFYTGTRKTWPNGRPLRLILRPDSDSDTDIIKSMSPEMSQAITSAQGREGMIKALNDQANANRLETLPGALGTTTLAQIISENRALQPLALDGVMPGLQALAEGRYLYYKTFFMVSGPQSSLLTKQFSDFVRSAAGREILEKSGHWVSPPNPR